MFAEKLISTTFLVLTRVKLKVYGSILWSQFIFLYCWSTVQNEENNYLTSNDYHVCFSMF